LIVLKSPEEIEKMEKAGSIVGEVLESIKGMIQPGITTKEIELFADGRIKALGSLRLGYRAIRQYLHFR
jgi:methionyl aminopeptidase